MSLERFFLQIKNNLFNNKTMIDILLMFYRGGGMPKTAAKPSDVLDNILPVPAPPAAPVQQVF